MTNNLKNTSNKALLLIKENKYIKLTLSKTEVLNTDIGSAGFKYIKDGKALGEE